MLTRTTTVVDRDTDGQTVAKSEHERQVYTYDELEERAQERVFDRWVRGQMEDPDSLDCARDSAAEALELLGIKFKTRPVKLYGGGMRHDPCVWYSVGGGQGDGACWEGSYSYQPGAHLAVRHEWPGEKDLHAVADGLLGLQRRHRYRLTASVTTHHRMQHSRGMRVTVFKNGADFECEELVELLRDSADWVYSLLRREADWQVSRENFNESRDPADLYYEDGRPA